MTVHSLKICVGVDSTPNSPNSMGAGTKAWPPMAKFYSFSIGPEIFCALRIGSMASAFKTFFHRVHVRDRRSSAQPMLADARIALS